MDHSSEIKSADRHRQSVLLLLLLLSLFSSFSGTHVRMCVQVATLLKAYYRVATSEILRYVIDYVIDRPGSVLTTSPREGCFRRYKYALLKFFYYFRAAKSRYDLCMRSIYSLDLIGWISETCHKPNYLPEIKETSELKSPELEP